VFVHVLVEEEALLTVVTVRVINPVVVVNTVVATVVSVVPLMASEYPPKPLIKTKTTNRTATIEFFNGNQNPSMKYFD
jgi:hypothetical protein